MIYDIIIIGYICILYYKYENIPPLTIVLSISQKSLTEICQKKNFLLCHKLFNFQLK